MTKPLKPTALLAVPAEISAQAIRLFEPDFTVTVSTTFAQAKKALKQSFDVIAAASSFDESRMFDLLRYCKAQATVHAIPFVAMRIAGIAMDDTTHQAIHIAAQALGAEGYIDLQRLPGLPDKKHDEFRQRIKMLIEKKRFAI